MTIKPRRTPGSSSSNSTAWARRGAPRNFTKHISETSADNTASQIKVDEHENNWPARFNIGQWIDIDRAGIFGHSGGGFATADAMFRYPDFFKVGISESGNHDNRVYEDDWGEKWQGLLAERSPKGVYEITTTTQINSPSESARREKLERPSATGAWNDGQQRSAKQHAARSRCANQSK